MVYGWDEGEEINGILVVKVFGNVGLDGFRGFCWFFGFMSIWFIWGRLEFIYGGSC